MKLIKKSKKLNNVLYDIRGPIVDRAKEMEAQGQQLIKLNIGNLASFDFQVPEEIQRDMILNLPNSAGYSDSKGIYTGGYSQCEQGFGGKGRDGGFFFPKRFVDHLTT